MLRKAGLAKKVYYRKIWYITSNTENFQIYLQWMIKFLIIQYKSITLHLHLHYKYNYNYCIWIYNCILIYPNIQIYNIIYIYIYMCVCVCVCVCVCLLQHCRNTYPRWSHRFHIHIVFSSWFYLNIVTSRNNLRNCERNPSYQ